MQKLSVFAGSFLTALFLFPAFCQAQTISIVSCNGQLVCPDCRGGPYTFAPLDGESGLAVTARALPVLMDIVRAHTSGNVHVVSHKATIRIALCSLLVIDVGRFRFRLGCPVGSVSVVEFGRHGPLVKGLADRIHLSERLRNLPGT